MHEEVWSQDKWKSTCGHAESGFFRFLKYTQIDISFPHKVQTSLFFEQLNIPSHHTQPINAKRFISTSSVQFGDFQLENELTAAL